MEYRDVPLETLHTHPWCTCRCYLTCIPWGRHASDSRALLAAAITTDVAAKYGTMVSTRVIKGLTYFPGGLLMTNASTMVRTTLGPFITTASGAGVLVDLRHMVSHNRQPPNDIRINTRTL